ncbi:hypothetical protein DFH11DRAFT_1573234 [Phellopilus nigrolimitatus]|nr:hypothetical protein DFH11DRAFT_1573234 [Phellopilus nigrolimitatus]
MTTRNSDIIEILSDDESPAPRMYAASANNGAGARNASSSGAPKLPRSRILAGKTFAFRGTWLTMTADQAEELCRVNAGEITRAITERTAYVVIGGKGTNQNTKKLAEHGATLLSEGDFLGMVLAQGNVNKENASLSSSTSGYKRDLEEPAAGPSKPSKVRKSDPKPQAEEEDMKWLHYFLADGEIQMKGKTLVAYDCGGQVYKAQRGKSAVELLRKFNKFLEDCKGEYHQFL